MFRTRYFSALLVAFLIPLPAAAGPLTVVNVGAPAINCVFNVTCTVVVNDSIGTLPAIPSLSGTARLQSRTYPGLAPAPASGLTAYVYRMDMTQAKTVETLPPPCVTKLMFDIGPVATLPYSSNGPAQVFVVTSGGLGSVGLSAAEENGNIVTFTFAAPVCPGQTSFFFGLAAKGAPKLMATGTALVLIPGETAFDIAVRVPTH